MLAVLEDAVGTFQKYANARERSGQRLFAEVEEWFESDDRSGRTRSSTSARRSVSTSPTCGAVCIAGATGQRARRPRAGNVVRFPFRRVNGSRT